MVSATRITLRRLHNGVTIRATGAAAQALADAIMHGAEVVRDKALPKETYQLVIGLVWNGTHYVGRTLTTEQGDENRIGLKNGVVLLSAAGEKTAIETFLKLATPPLKVHQWMGFKAFDRFTRLEYSIRAEVA